MANQASLGGTSYGLPGASKSPLAPGVTVFNGQYFYQGKPVTQQQAAQLNHGGFVPWQPPTVAPPGTYDPSLDAQQENANQGFGWASQDYELARQRGGQDYASAQGQLDQGHGYTLADLLTNNTRAGENYATSTGRLNEDYGTRSGRLGADYKTNTQDLARNYTNLGTQQSGTARSAGVGEGGALAAALAARQANQGHDQAQIDTGFQRGSQDLTTGRDRGLADLSTDWGRTQQDYGSNVGRENTAYGQGTGQLAAQNQRSMDDMLTGYQRTGVQNTTFGQQINAQKTFQAQQAGLLPTGPSNEFTGQHGPFRTEVHNGTVYHRYPDGHLVPIRKATGNG